MTRCTIEPPTYAGVRQITANARGRDIEEISAVCGVWNAEGLADEIVRGWTQRGAWGGVFATDRPIAVLTALYETPVSVQVGLVATDKFKQIALQVTRHVRRRIEPALRASGVTRAECRCWSKHSDARRWLALCGAHEEAEIPDYGANGETFIQMAWRS